MARSSGATPSLIPHSLAIGGPSPWADPRAYGARGDATKTAAVGSTTRGSTTVTISGASLTTADIGKLVSIKDLAAPTRIVTGSMTNGSNILTATGSPFSSSMIGMEIQVGGAGTYGSVYNALLSTITGFTDANHVTLQHTAIHTVSGQKVAWQSPTYAGVIASIASPTQPVMVAAPVTSMVAAEVTIGTDDTTAIQAAYNIGTGKVRFSGGPTVGYLVNGTITVPNGVHSESDGAVVIRHAANPATLFDTATTPVGVRFDNMVFDAQHVKFIPLITIRNGSRKTAVEECELRDIGPGRLLYWQEGAAQHSLVKLKTCTTSRRLPRQGAHYDDENVASIEIWDSSYVEVEGNTFVGLSATEIGSTNTTACSVTTPMISISVHGNTFKDVFSTTLWLINTASTYMRHVNYTGNIFENCGTWIEKGSIFAGLNGTASNISIINNKTRGGGYTLSSAGWAQANTPAMIEVFPGVSSAIDKVMISKNQLDGRAADGSVPTSFNLGIWVQGPMTGLLLDDNVVEYFGFDGIRVNGYSGALNVAPTISRNRVSNCVLSSDGTWQGAGITVLEYVSNPIMENNRSVANGASGAALTQTAGIQIGGYSTTGREGFANTVTGAVLRNNFCHDLGRARQNYGILFGQVGGTLHPIQAALDGNILIGNVLAGFQFDTSANRGHTLGRNPGYNTAIEIPLYAGSLANGGTATFTIPIDPQPFFGILTVTQKFGDASSVNNYYVWRNVDSSFLQTLSAAFGALTLGGGTVATIASTTPSTGTFTVTNNYAGGTSAIKVSLLPLTWNGI